MARTAQGADSPSFVHAIAPMKNAAQPSSPSARAVARQTETYETSVLVLRMTLTRCDAGSLAMARPLQSSDDREESEIADQMQVGAVSGAPRLRVLDAFHAALEFRVRQHAELRCERAIDDPAGERL